MCSILAILKIPSSASKQRGVALKLSATMRHRGPDWSGVYVSDRAILAHGRAWDEAFASMADPSGRAVNVHNDSYS